MLRFLRHPAFLFHWRTGLLVAALSLTTSAQYRFDHWTADNGLPQNSVRDIVQTRDGYLWLTTFDGLVRFDGVRFTVFNKSNTPGLLTNRFTQLYEDRQGALWASTEQSGVVRYWQGSFTSYTTANGLPHNIALGLGSDAQGNLLLVTQGVHYARWAGSQFLPADDLKLPHRPADTISIQHIVWLPQVAQAAAPWGEISIPPVQDRHGAVWFATRQQLIRFNSGQAAQPYQGIAGQGVALACGQPTLQALSQDAEKRLWVTNLETGQSRLLAQRIPEEMALLSAWADREGNYWFTSGSNGLWRARPQVVSPFAAAQGLTLPQIYPVLEDRDGSLWIGAEGGAVFHYQNGVFTTIPDSTKLLDTHISSLHQDHAGRVWINGRAWIENGRIAASPVASILPSGLQFIWTMFEDQQGAMWFGAIGGVVRVQHGQATHFKVKDGLAGDNTTVIIEDGAGGLWLGAFGGITHYRDGKFTAWTEKDGVPGETVRALKLDADGTLWIGTYDSGLGRFKDGRFTRFTTRDGLFDNGAFQMLDDAQGWLWISSNRGIYRVRKQELHDFAEGKIKTINSIVYGKSDGMPSAECNGGRWPAGVKTRDGKLWFPTMGGLAMIDPAAIKPNTQMPPVIIEAMRIDNQPVTGDDWVRALHQPQASIQLTPAQQNFEIDYTALSFINSENLRFRYLLEGADRDWIEAGTRRTAFFSHVPAGTYTFRVKAANSDGLWGTAEQRLRIQVLPPFYRTWWFITLTVLTVSGLLLAVYEYRVSRLKQARAQQQAFARQLIESQEAERKRIAAELHDSLGQKLVVIKNLALLHLQRPDAPASQIEELSAEASQAISEVKEIAYNLRPYQLDRIGLTKAIEALVNKAALASGIPFTQEFAPIDGLLPKDAEINFYRIVQESLNNLLKHAAATRAEVFIRQPGDRVELVISDNGRGFTATPGHHPAGFGLSGLQERARLLAGVLTIQSAPGQGTTIRLDLPIPPIEDRSEEPTNEP